MIQTNKIAVWLYGQMKWK